MESGVSMRNELHIHLFADNIQLYGFSAPSLLDQLQLQLFFIDDAVTWTASIRLLLNATETNSYGALCAVLMSSTIWAI